MTIEHHSRSRAMVRQNYDRLSRWYDLLSGRGERRLTELAVEALAIRPGQRVLEIGCGTGHGLLAITRQTGPAGRPFGLDLSGGMLAVAGRRMKSLPAGMQAGLVRGDAVQLPFVAASLDAILMSFTLELFDEAEIPVVLRECRLALRKEGRLGVVALSRGGRPSRIVRLYQQVHDRFPRIVDCRPIQPAGILQDSGFRIGSASLHNLWGLPVEIVVATA